MIPIHILQSSGSELDLTTMQTKNPTEPIRINRSLVSDSLDQSVFTYTDISKLTSSPYIPDAHKDPIVSSEDITDFDTDHTGYTSARSKTDETDSLLSYSRTERLHGVRLIGEDRFRCE